MSIMHYRRDPAFVVEVLKVEETTTVEEFAQILGKAAAAASLKVVKLTRGFDLSYTDRMGSQALRFVAFGSYVVNDEYGLHQDTGRRFIQGRFVEAE